MAEITHWADTVAEEVVNAYKLSLAKLGLRYVEDTVAKDALKLGKKHIVASGITPSGHIHIGNMREVVTADAAYRALLDFFENKPSLDSYQKAALREMYANAELIYIADNFDPLRKVYPFLPESYAEHVGKPLSEIPCPCGECKNYAEHFLKPFFEALERLGIRPKVYRVDELYKNGSYTEAIKTALIKRDEIAGIIEELTGKTTAPDWSPFNPRCSSCGRITTTKVTGFDADAETVDFTCECGHSGTVSMKGGGKLTWRVDWPARWKILGVTVEPFGKDHASRGGSYDTGMRITREIYGYEPPHPIIYEWIMLGKKGAMSSSTGVVVSISDMLKVVPPEVLRYLIIRTKPEKHIQFDPALPLLTLVDDYERLKSTADATGYDERVLELSHASGICHTDIPFKHMVTIYQVAQGDFAQIMKIAGRSGYDTGNEKCIRELADNVGNWLEMYAPPFAKFSVKETLPVQAATLSEVQKAFLGAFADVMDESGELSGEDYHNLVYTTAQEGSPINTKMVQVLGIEPEGLSVNPKDMFKAIYISLLGQQSGPKAGWFLSSLEKDFLVERFRSASTYRP